MHRRTSGTDDEEIKNAPKKVAEELGPHRVWEGPNVNESCSGVGGWGGGIRVSPARSLAKIVAVGRLLPAALLQVAALLRRRRVTRWGREGPPMAPRTR